MTINEAVRAATDPFGPGGTGLAARRPSASEVIERLAALGYEIKPAKGIVPVLVEIVRDATETERVLFDAVPR